MSKFCKSLKMSARAKPITLLKLRDCFTWISIFSASFSVSGKCLASYMSYEGSLQIYFLSLDITSSNILLIAFMSLYFSILFLSIIILWPACLCILYCALFKFLDCFSVSGIRKMYKTQLFQIFLLLLHLSFTHFTLLAKKQTFSEEENERRRNKSNSTKHRRWSSMISLFVMNAYYSGERRM